MLRPSIVASALALAIVAPLPAYAADIDGLKGQFTFNWRSDPAKTKCAAVTDELLAKFKSDTFHCDLNVITNTASDAPARVCTENGDGAEYLIFDTEKNCETERETQASNGD